MKHILEEKGLGVKVQQRVPLYFHGLYLDCDLRFDLMVENLIIVEVKAMDGILPIYEAQLLTYIKLMIRPKGILLNFKCLNLFKEGQKTMVNDLYARLPAK